VGFLRKKAKMKQTTLAERAGLTASWISKIETGKADPPWGTVRKLAAGLEVSMEELAEAAERFEEAIDT
jgi:transcriptional regulator with XRE-family HTH domain